MDIGRIKVLYALSRDSRVKDYIGVEGMDLLFTMHEQVPIIPIIHAKLQQVRYKYST